MHIQQIKIILEKVLNGIDLSVDDYIYLQQHQEEAKETHNIELIELATNTGREPCYKFNKII